MTSGGKVIGERDRAAGGAAARAHAEAVEGQVENVVVGVDERRVPAWLLAVPSRGEDE
jgi:hypothetical protein